MQLTMREQEKMMISLAAMIAQRRKDKGIKLNHPEAVALITDYVLEQYIRIFFKAAKRCKRR